MLSRYLKIGTGIAALAFCAGALTSPARAGSSLVDLESASIVLAVPASTSITSPQSVHAQKKDGKQKRTIVDDRHNITHPHKNATRWLNTMKSKRVAELFRTSGGLPGHITQVQQEINRVNSELNGKSGNEVTAYIAALKQIRAAIITSAKGAPFDFNKFGIKFSPLGSDLYLERHNGQLLVDGR